MDAAALFRRSAAGFNQAMLPLLRTDAGRRLLGGAFVVLTYRGRRSGREFTLPANYRRDGADLLVRVAAPGAKTWWRNFRTEQPVHVRVGSEEYDARATATEDAKGRVTVRIVRA